MSNTFVVNALWDGVTRDQDAELRHELLVRGKVAVARFWPFLAAARSEQEFQHRYALQAEAISSSIDSRVAQQVVDSLAEDWAIVHTARLAEQEEQQEALRVQAAAQPPQLRAGQEFFHVASQKWLMVVQAADGKMVAIDPKTAYIDPSDSQRYNSYGDMNPPTDNGALQGPDGFVDDLAAGEGRSADAYARQLTPGPWTVNPGSEWPVRPNAADPSQTPRTARQAPPRQSSSRVAGEGVNVWGTPKSQIDASEYCPDCEHLIPGHYTNCPHHPNNRQNGDSDNGAGGSGRPGSRNAAQRTAGEGVVATPGPNPNYFSQGTNGLQGPAEYPQDPGPEPLVNNLMDGYYGDVPPVMSRGTDGSENGPYSLGNPSAMAPTAGLQTQAEYHYVKKQGDQWVIVQKGTGKVLSHHDSQDEAEASFRAMMQSKHGSQEPRNFPEREASVGQLHNMQAGDSHDVMGHQVTYYAQQAMGDDNRPAKGFTTGGYSVEHPEGGSHYFRHSPYNPSVAWSASAKRYAAEQAMDYIRGSARKVGGRVAANFTGDHVQAYVDWARREGHDPDHVKTLKRYEQLPGIGRAHTNHIADQLYIGGGDQDWRKSAATNGRIVGQCPGCDGALREDYDSRGTPSLRHLSHGGEGCDPHDPEVRPYLARHGYGSDAPIAIAHSNGSRPRPYSGTATNGQVGASVSHQASTDGKIAGHCDNCGEPVRVHKGDGGPTHLRHLHNDSNKCSDGRKATAGYSHDDLHAIQQRDPDGMDRESAPTQADYDNHKQWAIGRYGKEAWDRYRKSNWERTGDDSHYGSRTVTAQFFDPTDRNVIVVVAGPTGDPAGMTDDNTDAMPMGGGLGGDTNNPQAGDPAMPTSLSRHVRADGMSVSRPTPENPTGRSEDEYQATHFDSLVHQRPMQRAEERGINTPVLPQEPIRLLDTSSHGRQADEEDENQNDESREASLKSIAQIMEGARS